MENEIPTATWKAVIKCSKQKKLRHPGSLVGTLSRGLEEWIGMKATKLSPPRGILQVMGEAYQEGSVGKAELLLLMHK